MNLAASGACAFLLGSAAFAQEAVPLTEELFTLPWVIADFEGRSDIEYVTPPTFGIFEVAERDVGGDTLALIAGTAKSILIYLRSPFPRSRLSIATSAPPIAIP
ncbi:hypothetical protein QWZ10_13455 [Paracoccus cavernae]|uniref:Uncharacterized protein n=1 Tax=Paracoccus cavernae TaxID=1571207 RepID=A0ABT8D6X2_9RHOB|nr:hypothetical protein [Paracoccus cavernae]